MRPLGQILVEQGALSAARLEEALASQTGSGLRLGDWLRRKGWVSEEHVIAALAAQFHCEMVTDFPADGLDSSLLVRWPVDFARKNALLPVRWKGGLALLTDDPLGAVTGQEVGVLLGEDAPPLLAPRAEVTRCIDAAYLQRRSPGEPSAVVTSAEENTPTAAESSRDLLRSADHAPVTLAVNHMILEALRQGASDVHIEPMERRLNVRFRLDGTLVEQAPLPRALEAGIISRLKIMARMDIAEKRLPQDGMARVSLGDREVDIRVSTVPVALGERVVLRLLRHDVGLRPLEEIGMSSALRVRFSRLIREPHGVIWVTGPTGSGKTTTLYAALQTIDTTSVNVMTIEDPIEYQIPLIGQIAVRPRIGLGFAQGLRHILRQDPDVVLVGETRDPETAAVVVQASLTGHLVFSTLHTNDALGAVVRLIDMGVEPYLVAEAVLGALAQRLVRVLCMECRRARVLTAEEISAPLRRAGFKAGEQVYEPVGCVRCRNGYAGRVGVFELVEADADLKTAMRLPDRAQAIRDWRARKTMPTLLDDALDKVRAGVTSLSEVARVLGEASLADNPFGG